MAVKYSDYNGTGGENTINDRYDFIYNGIYKRLDNFYDLKSAVQPGRDYFINLYYKNVDVVTHPIPNLFLTDFKSAFSPTQRKNIYDQEIKYVLNSVLLKYSQDKFSDPSLRNQKLVFERWISSLSDSQRIKKLKDGTIDKFFIANVYRYAAGDKELTDSVTGVPTPATVEKQIEDLIDSLGFPEFFNEESGFDFSSADEIGSVDDLERLTAEQMETLKNNVVAARGLEPDPPDPDQIRTLRQCALFSDLLHKGYSYEQYPVDWTDTASSYEAKCFNGRIYPVTLDKDFEPNSLINMCSMPNNVKNFFNNPLVKVDQLYWDLFWVYRDATGLKETKIMKKSSLVDPNDNFFPEFEDLLFAGLITQKQKSMLKDNANTDEFTIESVDVTYDGTNPATARNDVKVTVTIDLAHLSSINTTCAFAIVKDSDPGGISGTPTSGGGIGATGGAALIKIRDLVTIPQIKSVDVTTPGGNDYLSNTYTPETSRIRLKVWYNTPTLGQTILKESIPTFPTMRSTTDDALILDLALIDHSLTRNDDETNTSKLVITYRGYFEESMNAPFNDALSDPTIVANRINRVDTIKQARDEKCSDKLVRSLQKVLDEEQRIETEKFHTDGGLLKRLSDEGLLYSYDIDQTLYDTGLYGSNLDMSLGNYINQSTITRFGGNFLDDTESAARRNMAAKTELMNPITRKVYEMLRIMNRGYDSDNVYDIVSNYRVDAGSLRFGIGGTPGGVFFFLGDLMEILLDCLYFDDSPNHLNHTRDMNTRFIVGSIALPDPKDDDNTIQVNPLQIPIDIAFFASWYHDTIVKKGIQHYSIGPFIKDLLERLINDVLYDNCFSLLGLDESPPQLRSTFFSDHSDNWFTTKATTVSIDGVSQVQHWFNPKDFIVGGKRLLMSKDIRSPVASSKNYCVIYQQYPSYYRKKKKLGGKKLLKDNKYVPLLFDGYKSIDYNFLDGVTFSKAESNSYLREARYFNNSFGNLALFSNVYDLNFNIQTKKLCTFFYPGVIIDFLLTDLYSTKFVPGTSVVSGDLGDPHTPKTDPNVLGLGGYFIITSVTYKLQNLNSVGSSTVSIKTKYIGTDARDPFLAEEAGTNPFADEPKNCEITYNTRVDALRVLETTAGIDAADFTHIRTESTRTTSADSLPPIPSPGFVARREAEVKEAGDESPAQQNAIVKTLKSFLEKKSYDSAKGIIKTIGENEYTCTPSKLGAGSNTIEWTLSSGAGFHETVTITHR